MSWRMKQLREAPLLMMQLADEVVEAHQAIRAEDSMTVDTQRGRFHELSPNGRRRAGELRDAGMRKLDELWRDAQQARSELEDFSSRHRAPAAPADPTEALLAEQRQQRAWARIRQRLDAGEAWGTPIEEGAATGDVDVLHVLQAELPDYVRANGRHDLGDSGLSVEPPEVGAAVAGMRRRIDEALANSLPDGPERDAVRIGLELDGLDGVLTRSHSYAHRTITSGHPQPTLLLNAATALQMHEQDREQFGASA